MVGAALAMTEAHGGGIVHWWSNDAGAAERAVAAEHGLREERQLFQMRRPLPVEPEIAATTDGLELRPFVVGQDEDAWLRVNNRAFASHPEQGAWTRDDLEEREAEPWFDPDGFLLHDIDGALAGFCWTKVHRDHDARARRDLRHRGRPGVPRARARPLDDRRRARSRCPSAGIEVGMLYVDAANVPAVTLYYDLGFTLHHVRRAFVLDPIPDARPSGAERAPRCRR